MWVGIERHQHPPHSPVSLTCPSLRHPKRTYGPRLRAIALYLMSYQHLPFERCAAALCDLFGAEVSTGFLD
ncbi:MAG: hypothetical protein ACYCXY_13910, partial [Acidimicrobiales bacterium]